MPTKLSETDVRGIYRKWRYGAGVFRCFFRASNFISLKHYPDFYLDELDTNIADLFPVQKKETDSAAVVEAETERTVEAVISRYDTGKSLFIIDLPGVEVIKTAFLLHKKLKIQTIPVFGSPLHPYGLIGGKDYISALLGYGSLLDRIEPAGYAFILDWNRYGDYTEDDYRRNFNNQYELIDEDLPPVEMLKSLGYNNVVSISSSGTKEDCEAYLKYLEEAGFPVKREYLRED